MLKKMIHNPYTRLLSNPKYCLYFISRIISRLGDVAYKIGISWYALSVTGSAVALGNTLFFTYLPQFIFGFFSGYVADRFDRKKVMVVSDVIRGLLVLALILTMLLTNLKSMTVIYIISFLLASIRVFFSPASMAFIPQIVPKNQLVTAGAINSVSMDLVDILGNALAGLMIGLLGMTSAFVFDSFSFFMGAFLVALIGQKATDKLEVSQESFSPKAVFLDIKEGIHYVFKDHFIRAFLILLLFSNISYGIMYTLPAILVQNVLQMSAKAYGYIETSLALGMFIGVFLIGLVSLKKVGKLFIYGLFTSGLVLLAMASSTHYLIYLVLFFAFGLCDALTVPIYGYLQSYIQDDIKGRAFATIDCVIMLALPVIMLLIGHLVEWFGPSLLIGVSGLVLIGSGLMGWWMTAFREAEL